MVHCAECGTTKNLAYYGGRHLCASCRNMINGKNVQAPKTESEAKAVLQLSYLLGDKRK